MTEQHKFQKHKQNATKNINNLNTYVDTKTVTDKQMKTFLKKIYIYFLFRLKKKSNEMNLNERYIPYFL